MRDTNISCPSFFSRTQNEDKNAAVVHFLVQTVKNEQKSSVQISCESEQRFFSESQRVSNFVPNEMICCSFFWSGKWSILSVSPLLCCDLGGPKSGSCVDVIFRPSKRQLRIWIGVKNEPLRLFFLKSK